MTLSEFIECHIHSIVEEWEQFARTQLPAAQGLSGEALRDHAALMLHTFAADMNGHQNKRDTAEKSRGDAPDNSPDLSLAARVHAMQRFSQGFTLSQMVSEYRALRAAVIHRWTVQLGVADSTHLSELVRFGESLDQAMTESVSVYMEQVEQSRNLLLGILGHDLRNPLGAVIMSAEYLLRGNNLNGVQTKAVSRIANSGAIMKKMVDDLLDFTQTMLKHALPIKRDAADLGDICIDVINELKAFHPGRNVHFDSQGNLAGHWDAIRLRQMVSNLTANAIQHSAATDVVRLFVTGQERTVQLEVHNDGDVISEEVRRTLFKPLMAQPSHREDRHTGSSGMALGLYIAHEIAVAHDGTIAVDSTASEGTTVTVCLPRAHEVSSAGAGEADSGPASQPVKLLRLAPASA